MADMLTRLAPFHATLSWLLVRLPPRPVMRAGNITAKSLYMVAGPSPLRYAMLDDSNNPSHSPCFLARLIHVSDICVRQTTTLAGQSLP